jgi:hypothetical protein
MVVPMTSRCKGKSHQGPVSNEVSGTIAQCDEYMRTGAGATCLLLSLCHIPRDQDFSCVDLLSFFYTGLGSEQTANSPVNNSSADIVKRNVAEDKVREDTWISPAPMIGMILFH